MYDPHCSLHDKHIVSHVYLIITHVNFLQSKRHLYAPEGTDVAFAPTEISLIVAL
jgi:hypothetical protein